VSLMKIDFFFAQKKYCVLSVRLCYLTEKFTRIVTYVE